MIQVRQRGIRHRAFSVDEALSFLLSMVVCDNPAAMMSGTYAKLFLKNSASFECGTCAVSKNTGSFLTNLLTF